MSDASHITNFTTHVSQSPIIIRNFTTQSLQTNM